jgi:DNA-binding IclR family transcriptional regulator
MRNGTPQIASFERALVMLDAVLEDGGASSIAELARQHDIPLATAHRQVATLVSTGWLARTGARRHVAGPRLLSMVHRLDERQIIANVAAPILHRLAGQVRSVVQLGTFENDMVTYRIKTGQGSHRLFTQVGMQLEAYCSGIGKVLLAHLPAAERAAYLTGGPFVPLTTRTIVDPAELSLELDRVAEHGLAIDDGEIAEGLVCFAVPIQAPDGSVATAISVSRFETEQASTERATIIALLKDAAAEIELAAFSHHQRPD